MKKLASLLMTAALALGLAGCGSSAASTETTAAASAETTAAAEEAASAEAESEEPIEITIGVPTAPPALAVVRMMDANMLGDHVKINIDIWDAPETLIAMVQDDNHDMFCYPLNVVSKLYNKGVPVRLMNVNTWGVVYFVTTDDSLTEWSQLKGKTIYINMQSSPADVETQYFLTQAGLDPASDVNIVYGSKDEIATLAASGEAEYAVMLEPMVTRVLNQNENARVAFSYEEEWQKATGTDTKLPNAGFGTKQSFIDEHPELVEKVNEAYEEALNWVLANPEDAGALAEKYLDMNAKVVAKAIPNMGLEFKSAKDAESEVEAFYQLLYNFSPDTVGGKIPDSGLFYGAE